MSSSTTSIRRFSVALVGLSFVLLVGCDVFTDSTDDVSQRIRQRIQERRQQWQEQEIDNYRLVYSQEVGGTTVDTVRVFVRGGTVDSTQATGDVSEDALLVGTVESFFDLIEERVGEDESRFRADFDNDRGFPTQYRADFQDDRPSQIVLTRTLVESEETTGTAQK